VLFASWTPSFKGLFNFRAWNLNAAPVQFFPQHGQALLLASPEFFK
jgi:hypothetical protein